MHLLIHLSIDEEQRRKVPHQYLSAQKRLLALIPVCALFCHSPLHLEAMHGCFAGSLLQRGIALPALKGCRGTPSPSTPISYCCWDLLGGCGGGKASSLFSLSVASRIWALTRPRHVSTAVVQTISSADCNVSAAEKRFGAGWLGKERLYFVTRSRWKLQIYPGRHQHGFL